MEDDRDYSVLYKLEALHVRVLSLLALTQTDMLRQLERDFRTDLGAYQEVDFLAEATFGLLVGLRSRKLEEEERGDYADLALSMVQRTLLTQYRRSRDARPLRRYFEQHPAGAHLDGYRQRRLEHLEDALIFLKLEKSLIRSEDLELADILEREMAVEPAAIATSQEATATQPFNADEEQERPLAASQGSEVQYTATGRNTGGREDETVLAGVPVDLGTPDAGHAIVTKLRLDSSGLAHLFLESTNESLDGRRVRALLPPTLGRSRVVGQFVLLKESHVRAGLKLARMPGLILGAAEKRGADVARFLKETNMQFELIDS